MATAFLPDKKAAVPSASQAYQKTLLVLDFDHTIIADNSDTYVSKLCPNGKVPHHIKELHRADDWIAFMDGVFQYLHECGREPRDILDCIAEIELTEGMDTLFQALRDDRYETIVISDANSVFIDHVLAEKGIKEVVAATFTNPAFFDEAGRLRVSPYHEQTVCKLSSKNLCKGQVMERFIEDQRQKGVTYRQVVYVGDGRNDFCPSLRLSRNDVVCPRKGFVLCELINLNVESKDNELRAQVVPWDTADEIVQNCLLQ